MAAFRVIITPGAGADLEAIHDFIAEHSAEAARQTITRILDSIESLRQFPYRAPIERHRPGLRHPVRSLVISPYIIYYRIIAADDVIRVLHVRHGSRRPPSRFPK